MVVITSYRLIQYPLVIFMNVIRFLFPHSSVTVPPWEMVIICTISLFFTVCFRPHRVWTKTILSTRAIATRCAHAKCRIIPRPLGVGGKKMSLGTRLMQSVACGSCMFQDCAACLVPCIDTWSLVVSETPWDFPWCFPSFSIVIVMLYYTTRLHKHKLARIHS